MNNNELKIMVPKGWSVNEEMMPDGSRVLTVKLDTADDTTCHQQKGIFKLVRASELSLDDDFLKYIPKNELEKKFKREVKAIIEVGVDDFWRPVCAPSFDDKGRICYNLGKVPAVGKSYNWWEENAKKYAPEHGSRLGIGREYLAFLAVLIKEMVASCWKVADAWDAVCNDSKDLGHYWNSSDAKHAFEETGSREICGWCDLGNTLKILAEKEDVIAGGYYGMYGHQMPLYSVYRDLFGDAINYRCGWLVFDSCPDC